MVFQEIKSLDRVVSSVAERGTIACYDVSMRDNLDAMIKWAIATDSEFSDEAIDHAINTLVPDGRFNNFMLGSLYDAIMLNNLVVMKIVQVWVDCTKVEKNLSGHT
ncbi:hypothetical protein IWQ61_009445 [Dispira simplex]|nr:hypothetical protein IWQ61_009445 [Dispira simplex]